MTAHALDFEIAREPRTAGALVVLGEVTHWNRDLVLALAPRRDQERFSGKPAETLPAAEADPARRPVVILEHGMPAGFLVLHRGPVEGLAPRSGDLLLRGFMVDAARQGRGIATGALAALRGFVADHEPDARRLVLGVNVRNAVARHTYERAGFSDTGELYLGGALGPQYLLELPLDHAGRRLFSVAAPG